MTFRPSKYQSAIFDWMIQSSIRKNGQKNLIVEARAGSGKTTTAIEAGKLVPNSEEAAYIAFNKHIATELQSRLPRNVYAATYHSMGNRAIRLALGNNITMDNDKVEKMLRMKYDRFRYGHNFPIIKKLVSLCKSNLIEPTEINLRDLSYYHLIQLDEYNSADFVIDAVQEILGTDKVSMQRLAEKNSNWIDFDDMCYLPVILDMNVPKYDTMFVDELQDTNKVQIELALKSVQSDGRLIGVGDRFQSIYGFRGADVDAIPSLIERTHAEVLPLSITYRNPKCVVELVNKTFPYIQLEAAENAIEGTIRSTDEKEALKMYRPGDMVLCRCNAPLVRPVFSLIRNGIKAVIRGRDIGTNLKSLVVKMKTNDLHTMIYNLIQYKNNESAKLMSAEKYGQLQLLEDKYETIIALCDGVNSVSELIARIETVFSDEIQGVTFSSVHKAKGLEAKNVFILAPELMPHPSAKQPWQKAQESNIQYVAYTRTLDTLTFVSTKY